jgi:hypothetical protein
MFNSEWLTLALAALLFVSGLWFGWWLLLVAGVMVLALSGNFIWALLLSLLLDLYFGTPVGALHMLALPITFITLVASVCRSYLVRHLRNTRVY